MPKLDVRGQQSAAPGVQQIEAAYGGGMAAAQLKISDGLGKVAKAGVQAINFFDMQGEAEARVATKQMKLDADAKLREIEESDTPAVGREKEYTDWAQGEIKERGKAFQGSGARYWERAAGDVSDMGTIQARNSAQKSALSAVRAALLTESEIMGRRAEEQGNVPAEELAEWIEQVDQSVSTGAMTEEDAARLKIRTRGAVREGTKKIEEVKAVNRIRDSVALVLEEDKEIKLSEILKELDNNEFSSPQVKNAVRSDITSLYNQMRTEDKEEAAEAFATAQMQFMREPGNAFGVASTLSPEEGVKFVTWSRGWTGFKSIQSDPNTFNEIIAQMTSADPVIRAEFFKRDLMLDAGNLSEADYDRFVSSQPKEKSQTFDFLGSALSTFEAKAKLAFPSKTNTPKKVAALKQRFSLLYLNESEALGRKLEPPEILQLMDEALAPVTRNDYFADPTKPAILWDQSDIPLLMTRPGPVAVTNAKAIVNYQKPDLKQGSKEYLAEYQKALEAYFRATIPEVN